MASEESLYEIEFPERPEFPALADKAEADVVIIGGGLTGVSAALHLAENGFDVALLEAERLGAGGSGRNGGHVCQGWSSDFSKISRQLSGDDAKTAWDIGMEAVDLVKDRVAKHAIDCDLTFGYLHAAYHKGQMDDLVDMQREWEGFGYEGLAHLENKAALTSHIGTDAYVGGLFDAHSGHLQPLKYLHGLARAAVGAGARIYERTRVSQIETGGAKGLKAIHVQGGPVLTARILLLCGNAYLGDIALPQMQSRLAQVTSSVLATKPLSPNLARQILPGNAAVSDCNAALNYYRIDAKGRMIFGGRASYTNVNFGDVEPDLRRRMISVFPLLHDSESEAVWSGRIGITVSRIPHFGRTRDDIYFVQGFSGHGVALSGQAGVMLADAVIGDQTRFDVMSQIQHLPFPGGPFRTPALALGMAWFKLRDRLKF